MPESRQGMRGSGAIYPPFARPARAGAGAQSPSAMPALPDIEEFLDDLPPIEEFFPEVSSSSAGLRRTQSPVYQPPTPDVDDDGWVVGAWQRYDWDATTSLAARESDDSVADADWSATDWGSRKIAPSKKSASRNVGSSAHEIANALDSIASKIRSGELPVDNFRATPPEAAMAAALAALLKLRG